jgi:hypothetical protein
METNDTKPKTKKFAVIGITAGLLLGAGSGVLMNLPGGASAKSTTPQAISANDNSTDTSTPAAREAKLRETLQTLVAAGTIDASDVDSSSGCRCHWCSPRQGHNTEGSSSDIG